MIGDSRFSLAPVAIFAYNRADKLAGMLRSLQNCSGFSASSIVIFVDGPKGTHDANAVDAVREYVRAINVPNISWRFRDENLGLRRSIYAGVGELVRQHGHVIVLEDDLTLSPVALDYFNNALRHYKDHPRVWSICGYIYDSPGLRERPHTVVLPFAHPWGWATWEEKWNLFDLNNSPTRDQLATSAFKCAFDMNGLYPFTRQLMNSLENRVNSWFIHWYYTVFQHGGVSIFPPRRLVENFGFTDGVHGSSLNPYDRLVNRPALLESVPELSSPDSVDYAALDALQDCRELRVQRMIANAGNIKRVLKIPR